MKETVKALDLEWIQAAFVDRKLDYMLILSWFHLFTFNLIKRQLVN